MSGRISGLSSPIPAVRNAVWQIWFNRDYTAWAALTNNNTYTLTNWGTSEAMTFYVRKDIVSKLWPYGTVAQTDQPQPVDPYAGITTPVTPDNVVGGLGTAAGQFQAPRGIALAPDGSLYVADSGNNRIQHLSPAGKVLQVWGSFADVSKGAAPGGTFNEPWGVAVAPGWQRLCGRYLELPHPEVHCRWEIPADVGNRPGRRK